MKKVTMRDVAKTKAEMTGGLMTGTQVWRQAILQPEDSTNFNFAIVAFDSGSRNKFHKHSGDQILIITEGTGKVATDNEVLTVREGDVVLIPAGENHWHGAPDDTSMAHITVTVKGSQTEQTEA
ncbi:MAG: cupin domain-containing protein [Chloroflexi bacterium]|nr:cupin domain-containing protein [Chloroflexota bacterium]MCI0779922.1 cupin domain-containing protein [Chloroflexota bacterium]MCI0792598.1 cupin domain-containing protein [Chloroflexota bacterium]MCI0797150.1 cupin domain-containing protein [Chloroflexota bacterium]MCI0826021.1 cupin domain-containing protein [Chloroflexota bacterium]